jgi:dynein heavy chain
MVFESKDVIRTFLEDEKARFIGAHVISTFKVPPDRWEGLLKDDETRNLVGQMIKDPKCRHVFVFLKAKNILQATVNSLANGRRALAVYKMRLMPHDNAKEFIRSLAFVEIPKNPISAIQKMLDTVYGPLCKSRHNIERFSKPAGTDIVMTLSDITGRLYVVLGKSQGCTMLTIQPRDALTAERRPTILHTFESHLSQWVEQIRRFLSSEFSESETLGPLAEIKYWLKQQQNLELLKKQIDGDDVRLVMEALAEPSPPFVVQFRAVADEVDEALELATETTRRLTPLGGFLEQIEKVGSDMEGLCETFQPVFCLLWLMYSRTRWYHSPRYICTLLRRVSDFFNAQFASAIEGSSLTSGDPSNSLEHLEELQAQLSLFIEAYVEFKEQLFNQERTTSFTLNNQAVLPRFLSLCRRLEELKPIIQIIIEFNRFDKTEVGGIHEHILSPRFATLLDEFHNVEGKFTGLEFDLLKVPDAQFNAVVKELNVAFLNLDIRAVAIAIWAIQDVGCIVSLGQVLSGFNALLRRPFFIEQFQRQYPHIVSLFRNDVQEVSLAFREGNGSPPQLQSVPAAMSSFIWCNGLSQCLKILVEMLKNTIPEIFGDPAMKEALGKMDELRQSIKETTHAKIAEWCSGISDDFKQRLTAQLMLRDPKTRLLSLNFNPELLVLLQDVRYLERNIGDQIPDVAKEIYRDNGVYSKYIHKLQVLIE